VDITQHAIFAGLMGKDIWGGAAAMALAQGMKENNMEHEMADRIFKIVCDMSKSRRKTSNKVPLYVKKIGEDLKVSLQHQKNGLLLFLFSFFTVLNTPKTIIKKKLPQ
jgi:hypothetical protein